jgi:hypothetical protein
MAQHMDMDRERQPGGFTSPLDHAPDTHPLTKT